MKNKQTMRNIEIHYANTAKIIFIFTCLLFVNIAYTQKIEIIKKSDLKNLPKGKKYAFIEPTIDTSKIEFVATILARDKNKKSIIEKLYFNIREQATKLGANCYKLKSFTRDTLKNETVLILESYVASDSLLALNTASHEKNAVFIFGSDKDDGKTVSLNVNGETKEIKSETYFKFILKEGEELSLSKGGFLGEKMWLSWGKDKQPAFFSLSGFGLSDWKEQPANGVAFNSGRINPIENISFGLLLTLLFKQGN